MGLNKLDEIFTNRNIKNIIIGRYFNKSESTISLWRNNKRQPSLEEFKEIAKLLRMDIKDLFHSTSWSNESSETYEEYANKLKQEDIKEKEQLAITVGGNESFQDFLASAKDIIKIEAELVRLRIVDPNYNKKSILGAMRVLVKEEKVKYFTGLEGEKLYIFNDNEN